MAVKLHRCSTPWKAGPCWRVQKALDERCIDYEVVRGPVRPGKRAELQRISGQRLYPVIEFEDGSTYREESADMAATIRAGTLDTERRDGAGAHLSSCASPTRSPAGTADVAEPVDVFVLDYLADELRAVLGEPGERLVEVVHGEHDAQVAESVHRGVPVVGDHGRREEARELEPAVAVRRAHHGDLDALIAAGR